MVKEQTASTVHGIRQWTAGRLRSRRGFSMLELLIAALITGVVAIAGFQFYSSMHGAALSQSDISDLQNLSRRTIQDVGRTMRMAGFRLVGHPAWEIKSDTLAIYFSETKPVDTVKYFLHEFNTAEYAESPNLPDSTRLYHLMKQTNSALPAVFADPISGWRLTPVDSVSLAVTITAHARRPDPKYEPNNGYRRHTYGHRLTSRNP